MNLRCRCLAPTVAKAVFALGAVSGFVFAPQAAFADLPITTIASFNTTNGATPIGGITVDSNGNLIGTTSDGGANSDGTVFGIARGSGVITTLASFNGTNGANSFSPITLDSSGNFYGTTGNGGARSDGTVFTISSTTGLLTDLGSFTNTNGNGPQSGVTFDNSGNLYGTTFTGGANGVGVVYEVAKGTSAITDVASFNTANGSIPFSPVTFDSAGNLFGTTANGGANGKGVVFEIAKGTGAITVLDSFNTTNGSSPIGGLTFDSSGNLFGTTQQGGANGYGEVYEIASGTSSITTVASFNFNNGSTPKSNLIFDSSGNLFGTTSNGGANSDGTVFEIAKGTNLITNLASFNGTNGSFPEGNVSFDGSGNLYGTTLQGGANNVGTVFEIAGAAAPEPSQIAILSLLLISLMGLLVRARRRAGAASE